MHTRELDSYRHHHTFGTAERSEGERRTRWVVGLTIAMMVVEIVAGIVFGSMALLADGWHMGTHAAALGVAVFAYGYARRHASDPRFTFGTGKVGALAGFASAIGLAVVALVVLAESGVRLASPVQIQFNHAIAVAVVGLLVNLASAVLLREDHHEHDRARAHEHHDHNLRGAYLHVLADALTSVLAIAALVAGKLLGWHWMDPVMGIVGSIVIGRWSVGLLRDTSRVLLDSEVGEEKMREVRQIIEADEAHHVADLHIWRIGPRHLAAIVSVIAPEPRSSEYYKERLAKFADLAHVTVEVQRLARRRAGDRP